MNMHFKEFFTDEAGTVSVEWVVLTAAFVAMGIATVLVIIGPAEHRGFAASAVMESYEINGRFDDQTEIDAVMAAAVVRLEANVQ